MMTEQLEPKSTMIRYLLGQMPEHERASFEEQYQKDSDLFFELSELENDLIDLCALGSLSESEQEQMRSFLADPDRQKRLALAKIMVRYPDTGLERARLNVPEPPVQRSPWPSHGRLALRAVAALAAAVMIAGISWLFVADRNLRAELEALRNQQSKATTREQTLQQQIDSLTHELAQRGKSAKNVEQTPLLAQNTVSLNLTSDVVRGDGAAPMLAIPPSANFVLFHVDFPGREPSSYDLSLETAEGTSVFRQEHLKGRSVDGLNTRIALKLRSRILNDGDYVLRVTTTVDQKSEDVAGYSFRVVRR